MNPRNVKSITLTGLVLITATLSGCASFNSELQCPFKRGVSCRSLSDVNAAVSRGEFDIPQTPKHSKLQATQSTENKTQANVAQTIANTASSITQAKTQYNPSNTVIDLNNRAIETVNHHALSLDHQPPTTAKTVSKKNPHGKHRYTLRELRRLNEIQYSLQIEPEDDDASTAAASLLTSQDVQNASNGLAGSNTHDVTDNFKNYYGYNNSNNTKRNHPPSLSKNQKQALKPISLTELSTPIDTQEQKAKKHVATVHLNKLSQPITSFTLADSGIKSLSKDNFANNNDTDIESDHNSNDEGNKPIQLPNLPKRTQEHISMIYIAPYVDENGDYHAMQTIYHVDKPSEWE